MLKHFNVHWDVNKGLESLAASSPALLKIILRIKMSHTAAYIGHFYKQAQS